MALENSAAASTAGSSSRTAVAEVVDVEAGVVTESGSASAYSGDDTGRSVPRSMLEALRFRGEDERLGRSASRPIIFLRIKINGDWLRLAS